MMYLSKTAGYAIHALGCIQNGGPEPRFIRDIAGCTGLKKPYLAKIVNQLVHHGLAVAKRGYRGGVALARPPENTSLLEIVKAIEGEEWASPCLFGLEECPAGQACPAHALWVEMRSEMEAVLCKTTLADVIKATRVQKRTSAGKMARQHRQRKTPTAAGCRRVADTSFRKSKLGVRIL